ncbi:MAG: methenyltetrahydromethanopterin cyclohydrolase [Planctomycetota bacterium]
MNNEAALRTFRLAQSILPELRGQLQHVAGASVLDLGVNQPGSLQAGTLLAEICLAAAAQVRIVPADFDRLVSANQVTVQTDTAVAACLGGQYAGWPVQTDDFFAMGSGPMRMRRGREPLLQQLNLADESPVAVGVLESDKLPSEAAVELIAEECETPADQVHLAIAPSTSLAGSIQVVARSVETALHKLHELSFDVTTVVSATGTAPLPPPAKPGDTIAGIGRTNDAMLYGAHVTLWVDSDDESIDAVAAQVISATSKDYGRPFASVFKDYDYDFYKVDPLLFSPAVVTLHNLKTGRTWHHGQVNTDVLRQSFLS